MNDLNFFTFSWDESGLKHFLKQIGDHLSRHDQEIDELRRTLASKPDFADLDSLRDLALGNANEGKFNDLQDQITRLRRRHEDLNQADIDLGHRIDDLDAALTELETKFTTQLAEAVQQLRDEIAESAVRAPEVQEVSISQPNDYSKDIMAITARMAAIEGDSQASKLVVSKCREDIDQLARALGTLESQKTAMESIFQRSLNGAVSKIVEALNHCIDCVRDLGLKVDALAARVQAPRVPPEPDLYHLHLRPEIHPDWTQEPQLPKLTRFGKIAEAVDYKYAMVPKLQGYLSAIHNRLLETADLYPTREEVQGVLDEILNKLDDLGDVRKSLFRYVTKSDLASVLKRLGHDLDLDAPTAVGRVRCVACGRDVPQIAGAMTEREVIRSLGVPTNSIAGKAGMGQLFSDSAEVDSAIVESPRSKRPFKASIHVLRRRDARVNPA
jgi:hypothetical protein